MRSKRTSLWLFVFGVVPALAILAVGGALACRAARDLAMIEVGGRVDRLAERFDRRVDAIDTQLSTFVDLGFSRLSTESIVGHPRFGIVDARLRSTHAVAPLEAPFDRLAIVDGAGEVLWVAEDPAVDAGGLRFARVEQVRGSGVDTLGVALAISRRHKLVVRVGDHLRFLHAFDTDPYNETFVLLGDLPVGAVCDSLMAEAGIESHKRRPAISWRIDDPPPAASVATLAPSAAAPTLAPSAAAPTLAPSGAVSTPASGGDASMPASSGDASTPGRVPERSKMAVDVAGAWPDEVWSARSGERFGLTIIGSASMRPVYERTLIAYAIPAVAVLWMWIATVVLFKRRVEPVLVETKPDES